MDLRHICAISRPHKVTVTSVKTGQVCVYGGGGGEKRREGGVEKGRQNRKGERKDG